MTENPTLESLLSRRSVLAANLLEPGPTEDELQLILQAAHRVPDHGKLGPWRFIVFQGDARVRFGSVLKTQFAARYKDASETQLKAEENRFERAPLVIAVVSSVQPDHKIPVWEQELSAGAACQNILQAASSLGYGAQWITEWYAFDSRVNQALSLTGNERIAGFIYIGSFDQKPKERVRPDLKTRILYY